MEKTTLQSDRRASTSPKISRTTGIAIRLFVTCWLMYSLHFTTNIVRELYLTMSIGDHFSFKVDEYANMHPDLFEKEGYGWHIGSNPGVSMVAAVPYALLRPITDRIVEKVRESRSTGANSQPPEYDSPWPMAREFFKESWKRGFDIKFGMVAMITQILCMAPSSALAVVLMFYLLRRLFESDKAAMWLSLLYAFGTPVFFRTGFLNHNLMLGHIAFLGFVALWNPWESTRWSIRARYLLAGFTGGVAVLFDYSGSVILLGLFLYALAKSLQQGSVSDLFPHGCWFFLGTLPPVFLLWFYQWASFGNLFLPGQHWMPSVEWIDLGYQGFSLPRLDLFLSLGFDYRYGLFTSCPLMLAALLVPYFNRGDRAVLPQLEMRSILLIFTAFWIFFSCVSYTQLQYNTGIRYMAAIFPFLFVLAAVVLARLSASVVYFIAVFSVVESWALAMHRDVERGLGLLDPIATVFFGGFKLPVLTVLSRMGQSYGEYFANGVSPIPIFLLVGAIIFGIWYPFKKLV